MSRPSLRRLTSLFGTNGRRTIVVLMVVAVGALLAVPATAGAHVDKKHKAQFRHALDVYGLTIGSWSHDFTLDLAMLTDMERQMRQALSADPPNLENLRAIEEDAGRLHDMLNSSWKSAKPKMDKAIDRFYAKSLPWFKTKADRSRLHQWTQALKGGFDTFLGDGLGNLSLAALALHDENFTVYGDKRAEALTGDIIGEGGVDTALSGLKKLL